MNEAQTELTFQPLTKLCYYLLEVLYDSTVPCICQWVQTL